MLDQESYMMETVQPSLEQSKEEVGARLRAQMPAPTRMQVQVRAWVIQRL